MTAIKKNITPLLVLLCPFIYFIKFFHVPMAHPDIAILLGLIIVVSAFFSWLLWRVSPILPLAFLIIIALSFFPAFQKPLWFGVMACATLGVMAVLKEQAVALVMLVASVFGASLLLFPVGKQLPTTRFIQKPDVKFDANLPPIIHIILDEHIGIQAVPTDLYHGTALQNDLKNFYLDKGFRVYENAYSRYIRTYDSIPNLLNFTAKAQDAYYLPHNTTQVKENADFALLSKKGYKIRVYQSDYLNFCHAKGVNYASCMTYSTHSLPALYQLSIPWQQRSMYLLKSYLLHSAIYKGLLYSYAFHLGRLLDKWHVVLPALLWDQDQLATLLTFQALDQLKNDVMQAPAGTVFFAHILLPHSPYVVDADCNTLAKPEKWLVNFDYGLHGNTPTRRELRYGLYENQLRCVYKHLQPMITAWQEAGVWDNAMVIVQGDHSARVPVMTPLTSLKGRSNWRDFLDSYATLYAVKAPGYAVGIDPARLPITHLLGQFTQEITGNQLISIDSTTPFVFLTSPQAFSHTDQVEVPLSIFKWKKFDKSI